jgi:hypothetical protein
VRPFEGLIIFGDLAPVTAGALSSLARLGGLRPPFLSGTSPLPCWKQSNPTELEDIISWAGIIVFGALAIAGLIALVVLAFYAA